MKHIFLFFILSFCLLQFSFCQENENPDKRIFFRGVVMDAGTLGPIPNTQILINNGLASVSNSDGSFSFYINRKDSVLFKHLGYKSTFLPISDTLRGKEFVAGVYMNSDTLQIGEVIIIPRFINLKSQIINSPSKIPSTMDNARYNVAVSAYQGRTTTGKLGDPASNYRVLHQQQKVDAYEKGGIPSDRIAGLSPLLLIPAAYLLIHGAPEKPAPMDQTLTDQELKQINQRYMETLKSQK
jgi:hypothetical protein